MCDFDIITKIETLTSSEQGDLVSFILSRNSRIYQLQFILFNLDRYNSLDENILEEKIIKDKIKKFLSQKKFNIFRDIILRNVDTNLTPVSRKEFLEYEIANARNSVIEGGVLFIEELNKLEDEYYIKRKRKLKLKALYEKEGNN